MQEEGFSRQEKEYFRPDSNASTPPACKNSDAPRDVGESGDWYEAYSEGDVWWARRLDYVLRRHKIPRGRSKR